MLDNVQDGQRMDRNIRNQIVVFKAQLGGGKRMNAEIDCNKPVQQTTDDSRLYPIGNTSGQVRHLRKNVFLEAQDQDRKPTYYTSQHEADAGPRYTSRIPST